MASTPRSRRSRKTYPLGPWGDMLRPKPPKPKMEISAGPMNSKMVPKSNTLVVDKPGSVGGAIGGARPRRVTSPSSRTRMGPPSPRRQKPLTPTAPPRGRVGGEVGYRAPTKKDKAKQMIAMRHRLKDRG